MQLDPGLELMLKSDEGKSIEREHSPYISLIILLAKWKYYPVVCLNISEHELKV